MLLGRLEDGHAVHLAHPEIGDDQIEASRFSDSMAASPPSAAPRRTPPTQHDGQQVAHALLVVDDENPDLRHDCLDGRAARSRAPPVARAGGDGEGEGGAGARRLWASISPPCSCTMRCTRARPRPLPSALVEKKGSKIWARSVATMPSPLPLTRSTRFRPVTAVVTRSSPPSGIAWKALTHRFQIA